ncbi:hypothetical protein PFICI_11949 [Pestalotiopsis fici W106-1]|uniref:Xylanolytic transcriptional activator regulatory domain-containing protein n=1 Tax=Pestalotiopsis fici (strain W106-1 / CGMCC3.15140) TaxID=1229662 RepID=W3WTR0_PESFW|nr:uncharacterized protein PFICI_11949 [Pestalotiopsis fici W106-1]ETS76562.1 hypothetical protein PFICI_11949 [Pestalotiopsis fici W106-1]
MTRQLGSAKELPDPNQGLQFEQPALSVPRATVPPSPHRLTLESVGLDSQLTAADKYRQLGHSSSWSFSRRVRELIRDTGNGPELHDRIIIRDGSYGVPWERLPVDLNNLDVPSPEYAEYLLSTISYSLGSMYYLFDKAEFLKKFQNFSKNKDPEASALTDPWLIQMLIILGLGKSIAHREPGPSGPSGHVYFARAVQAFPSMYFLYEEPILSIEILCASALFLQMMDMRLAAYGYLGDAIGMCLAMGLNRKHDASRISPTEFSHRSKLFWTAYVLDRKLSSLIGVPPRLHDDDIGLPKPSLAAALTVSETIMAFHIDLSSRLGEILQGSNFVHAVQSVLKRQSDGSKMLQEKLKLNFSMLAVSETRAVASLYVLHNLCTIMTIRPVLFFIFEQKVGHGQNSNVSDASRHLLNLCTEAALNIQEIIHELSEHNIIVPDLLLPFDVDALFASAVVLILVDVLLPSGQSWDAGRTLKIMDDMALRRCIIVGPYKRDLIEIESFRQHVRAAATLHEGNDSSVGPHGPASTTAGFARHDINGGLVSEQHVMFESALEFLNCSFPDCLPASDLDPFAWVWGDDRE